MNTSPRDPSATGTSQDPYFAAGTFDLAMSMLDRATSVGFEAVVELSGQIETGALERAWKSVRARHPILSAQLVDGLWRQVPGAGGSPTPVRMTTATDAESTRVTLHCHHVAFDGVGSVILLDDLRKAYVQALSGTGIEQTTDWTSRTVETAATPAAPRATAASTIRTANRWWRLPPSTHRPPQEAVPELPAHGYHLMEFGPVLRALDDQRRRYHWPTDAVLVGVLERAWAEVFGPPASVSGWLVARDLRPDLGVSRGMGNLSALQAVTVDDPSDGLWEAIDAVAAQMASQRSDLTDAVAGDWHRMGSGLAGPTIARALSIMDRRRYHRSVSNVGDLGASLDDWGTARLSRVYFVGPMAHPPYVSFIAAGRGDSTLVSVRVSNDWLTSEHSHALERAAHHVAGVEGGTAG